MVPETILTKKQEAKENLPFKGRRVFITGGTSGTGLAAAIEIQRLGGEVIIGTRSREHFEKAAGNLTEGKTYPFIADLTKENQVREEIMHLATENNLPTDFIHSAAGGMEAFLGGITFNLARLLKIKDQKERQVKIEVLRERVAEEVNKYQSFAQAINFNGAKALMEEMYSILPEGARLIYYSSPWSSLYNQAKTPLFYQPIAGTKHMMEEWLSENSKRFTDKGIYPAIISGTLILDTNIGKVIERLILPLLSENEREIMRQSAISMKDMVDATVEILKSDPMQWVEYPKRLWVYGEEGQVKIAEFFPVNNLFMQVIFPF